MSQLLPGYGAALAVLRLMRILGLLALFKFRRYSIAMRRLVEASSARPYELEPSVLIAGLAFMLCAAGVYIIEGENQPEAFGSIPRALGWSMIILTTVGYGDV